MSDGSHVVDLLAAYALGSLEEPEARRVAEHLAACAACRAELAEFEDLTGLLALGVAEAQPPESVRRQLLERASHRRPAPRWGAPTPWTQRPIWAATSLVLLVALVLSNALLWQRLLALSPRPDALTMRAVAMHNLGVAPQASGYVLISADGQNGTVVVDELTPLSDAQAYQLWLIRAGQVISGALFTVDATGYRGARIVAPDSLLTYTSVQITIEPAAGSLAPTGQAVFDAALNTP